MMIWMCVTSCDKGEEVLCSEATGSDDRRVIGIQQLK